MRDDDEMHEMMEKDLMRAVLYGRGAYCRRAAVELSDRGVEPPARCKAAAKRPKKKAKKKARR